MEHFLKMIFLENFRIIWKIFGNLCVSSEVFEYSCVMLENPGNSHDKNLTPLSQKKLAGIQIGTCVLEAKILHFLKPFKLWLML